MFEPNPYEPPQTPEPPKPAPVVRRGFSVAAILLMSPFVSMVGGCFGFWLTIQAILLLGFAPGYHDGLIMLVAMTTFALTLAAMLRWAWWTHHVQAEATRTNESDDYRM